MVIFSCNVRRRTADCKLVVDFGAILVFQEWVAAFVAKSEHTRALDQGGKSIYRNIFGAMADYGEKMDMSQIKRGAKAVSGSLVGWRAGGDARFHGAAPHPRPRCLGTVEPYHRRRDPSSSLCDVYLVTLPPHCRQIVIVD